ncbi:MAG: methylated-DNA--[protein]-cysteine S-methyltransferase [Thermodesulfobacteriota bacterium]
MTGFMTMASIPAPWGMIWMGSTPEGLCGISLRGGRAPLEAKARVWGLGVHDDPEANQGAIEQLREYFEGKREEFDLPLDLRGTRFQLRVWRALQAIPFGETRSYKDIAFEIGHPGAFRAVGQANGRNPVPIVIPCHRVLRSDGGIGGFSSGLDIKARLLAMEAARREV